MLCARFAEDGRRGFAAGFGGGVGACRALGEGLEGGCGDRRGDGFGALVLGGAEAVEGAFRRGRLEPIEELGEWDAAVVCELGDGLV